jgi:CBS domain-containing protein
MKARDIMTTEMVTLRPETPIREIAQTFRRLQVTGAPVVWEGEVLGVVTQIDLIARHARPHSPFYLPLLDAKIPLRGGREYREILRRILGLTAQDIMTTPAITVDAEADLEEVATLMVESKANPLPVVEEGKLVGVIGHADLIAHLEEAQEPIQGNPGSG